MNTLQTVRGGLGVVWVYLVPSPLLWLTVTIGAYALADRIAAALRRHPLANPLLMAIVLVAGLVVATGTPYADYFAGAQFVHVLLGPATVALAVPLWRSRKTVLRALIPLLAALVVGCVVSIASAVGIAWAFGAPRMVIASLAPKSVTTAIAMGVAEAVGGNAALAATIVIITGIFGAIVGWPMLERLRVRDPAARGFAIGLAAHGMGTARCFQSDPMAGTFAGIAMGLNGMLTAFLVPVVLHLFGM